MFLGVFMTLKYKLKDLPKEERPRERLIKNGVNSLSNSELIAIILEKGSKKENVLALSNRILTKYNIKELSYASTAELKTIFGISDAKACSLIAAFELGRRVSSFRKEKDKIEKPEDVFNLFPEMQNLRKEVLKCICLDSKARILKSDTISIGGLNTNNVEARDVFKSAVAESAAAMVLIHNHPSGDPTPSKDDTDLTLKVIEAGKLLGIEILDHIIIGDGKYFSFKESELF